MRKLENKQLFDFDDINIIPNYSEFKHRSDIDTSIKLGENTFKMPVVPANMESTINKQIAFELAKNNYFYILHRFYNSTPNDWINEMIEFCKECKNENIISSISIGVKEIDYNLISQLKKENITPDYITIDIAHGHSVLMKDMIKYIKEVGLKSFIIAGNIATTNAYNDLYEWGANAVKVGIAPGSACTTSHMTNVGTRGIQASIVEEIYTHSINSNKILPIIADGGIKQHGHISTALGLGATFVMIGNLFARCVNSPAPLRIDNNGNKQKEYWGSASSNQNNKTNHIEGTTLHEPLNNKTYLQELKSMQESLQSAMSYVGFGNLNKYIGNIDYIYIK